MRQLKITKSITNRESASLDKYLQEIGREDLITVEEEVELAQRIRKGDRVALEKLTRANLRFVVSVAKQYQNQGLSLPDLINEGNLGLIKAAEKFDETRGFKFISYAVWWIRQSILQALAEQSRIVRLPLNQVGSLNKISKAFSKFEQENGHHTDTRWIALSPNKGNGLVLVADSLIGFNALRNSIEDFDSEEALPHPYQWNNFSPEEVANHDENAARNVLRRMHHVNDITPRDFVEVCVDMKQQGVGGYDSWGARPEPFHQIPANRDYQWGFTLVPVRSANQANEAAKYDYR